MGRTSASLDAVDPPGAVVFDLGGVAIRWTDEWTFRKISRTIELPLSRVRAVMEEAEGPLELGEIDLDEFWHRVAERFDREVPRRVRGWWTEEFGRRARPSVTVARWVRRLRALGFSVACLSNTDPYHVRILRARGWLAPFSPALLSCELGLLKPGRAIFDRAREAIGMPASRILFLDDRRRNVIGARRAGWTAVRFASARAARPALERWVSARLGRHQTF